MRFPSLSSETSSASSSASRPLIDGTDASGLLDVPPQTQLEIMDRINATVDDVLDSMAGDGPSHTYWRPNGVKKAVAYFVDDNVNPDQYRFCCVGETRAHTTDLMKLFRVSDTATLLKNNRVLYNNVLDARILSVLENPTREHPFKSVYLRYSCFATPTLMDDRDMCVVVATDVLTCSDGATIGYCLFDSVELPEVPGVSHRRGLVRSRLFRSGFFFHTTTNDTRGQVTKIVYLVGLEAGGATPRLAAWLVMEKFGAVVERLCRHVRRKRFDPGTFRARDQWISVRGARQCRGCTKCFGSFARRRHNCVACGEVFCTPCTAKERVDVPGAGITSMRFCLHCLDVRGVEPRLTTRHGSDVNTRRSIESVQSGKLGIDTATCLPWTPTSTATSTPRHQNDGFFSRFFSSSTSSSVELTSRS